MQTVRNLISGLTPKGKAALAGSVVGVLLLAFFMIRIAVQPSYTTILSGIDPAQTGKMTAALDKGGIPYELQNNGTALAVDKSQTAQARVALAEGGMLGQGETQQGFELFDKQKLGASDFQQKVTYQRALEGQIARTVEQVQGVSGAQVQLVMPDEQLFTQDQTPTTAAVLLQGGASSLDPGAVRGIAQLVASSVKGLKVSNVSITDATGQLLWPKDGGGAGGDATGSATLKQAAEARYDQQLADQLNAMLLQTVGPGKARVQVHANLNTDQTTKDSLSYAKRGTPLHRATDRENLQGGGAPPGGAAGTAGNIPSYAAGAGGRSRYRHGTATTDYAVGKQVTHTTLAPGRVQQQGVSLIVDSSVPPAAVRELRRAVSGAAGIDAKRGDTLAVSQFPFAQPAAAKTGVPVNFLEYAKYAGLGLAALLFLVFVSRHLRRREEEALPGEPIWLREIEAPTPIAALEADHAEAPTEQFTPIESHTDPDAQRTRAQVEDLVGRNPERVAQQVRAWMQDD